jgi:hypothetical protein
MLHLPPARNADSGRLVAMTCVVPPSAAQLVALVAAGKQLTARNCSTLSAGPAWAVRVQVVPLRPVNETPPG